MKKRFWFDKLNLRQKKLLGLHRDLTHHVEYAGKICREEHLFRSYKVDCQ